MTLLHTRCSSFIATSLDGFISRPDGAIDWLEEANKAIPAGEDCGYADHMATVDAIVMGRHTFEQVLSFQSWPYSDAPVYVLSSSLRVLPAGAPDTVTLRDCTPGELVAFAGHRGHRSLYVDGGRTIQRFIAEELLDEITITVIPVLLGAGRPLFSFLPKPQAWLRHVSSRVFPFGFVQNRYVFPRRRLDQGVNN